DYKNKKCNLNLFLITIVIRKDQHIAFCYIIKKNFTDSKVQAFGFQPLASRCWLLAKPMTGD
ncbi:MAG: hypothetical protein PVJ35_16640, partial [Desulfobacterales bacterium]